MLDIHSQASFTRYMCPSPPRCHPCLDLWLHRTSLALLLATLLSGFLPILVLQAASLSAPIEREITDIFGRTVQARIVAVTETTLTIERLSDQTRFDLIIDNLSDQDRQFAKELYTKTVTGNATLSAAVPAASPESKSLPDTPWLAQVRRDFRIYDAKTKQLVPPPNDYWAMQKWFIINVDCPTNPTSLKYFFKHYTEEQAGILFLYSRLDRLGSSLEEVASNLPPGAAILSLEAFQAMLKTTSGPCQNFQDQWFKDATSQSRKRQNNRSIHYNPTEAELAPLHQRMLSRIPNYWPCLPDVRGAYANSHDFTPSYIYSSNGIAAIFRGVPAAGDLTETLLVVRTKRDELQTP